MDQPTTVRKWWSTDTGIGRVVAIFIFFAVLGSLIPLWPWSEHLGQLCIGGLAFAIIVR